MYIFADLSLLYVFMASCINVYVACIYDLCMFDVCMYVCIGFVDWVELGHSADEERAATSFHQL